MIEETGRVVAVDADTAWVETVRAGGCGRCSEPGGCGNAAPSRRRPAHLRVALTQPVAVGDTVVVGIAEGAFMAGVFSAYVLPLGGLVAGAVLAGTLLPATGDGATLGGAVGGLLGGLVLARLLDARGGRHVGAGAVIVRRLPAGSCDGPAPPP